MKTLFTSFLATLAVFAASAVGIGSYAALILYTPVYVSLPLTFAACFGLVWAGMYNKAKKIEDDQREY